ncbi:MAG TPA: Maf family nucleotide pyrophosphatase [Draconibacterium sp.]|nr:Maf family nucleotide pyrophosphatase [Draconibacterium sp.]
MNWYPEFNFILASKSPRRQQLLKSLDIDFSVKTLEVDETYPDYLSKEEVPVYLAELKAKAFLAELEEKDLLITADTIVCLRDQILGKPGNYDEAFNMLRKLSACKHEVITGVCLTSVKKKISFYSSTEVEFKELSDEEIDYYIQNYHPFDKAGAYGIQEWIGSIGIRQIEGSFYNVMGLPIQKLYETIKKF